MKKLMLLILTALTVLTLSANTIHEWWYLGVANTQLSNDYVKDVEKVAKDAGLDFKFGCLQALQLGYSFIVEFKNKFNWGMNAGYIEKGWTTESEGDEYTQKNSYIEAILRGGYSMPEIINIPWYPYVGMGYTAFLNSDSSVKSYTGHHFSFVAGLDINFSGKAMLGINCNMGLTEVMKNTDAKFRTYNITLGRKF